MWDRFKLFHTASSKIQFMFINRVELLSARPAYAVSHFPLGTLVYLSTVSTLFPTPLYTHAICFKACSY